MSRGASVSLLLLLAGLGCSPLSGPAEPPAKAPREARRAVLGASDAAGALQSAARARLTGEPPARFGRVRGAWTPPADADAVASARAWAAVFAAERGVSPGVADQLVEVLNVPMRGGGAVIRFVPEVDGLRSLRSELTVLLDAARRPVAWSVGPHFGPALGDGAREEAVLDASEALGVALGDRFGVWLVPADIRAERAARGAWQALELESTAAGIWMARPARARQVWWPAEDGSERLLPAWEVELFAAPDDTPGVEAWSVVVDAVDGVLLSRRSLMADGFTYRVWADTSGLYTPADSPTDDATPHPTGAPDGTTVAVVSPSLITLDGFNTNPSGSADPWLDPSATETSGNNVDAYTDRDSTDGFSGSDLRATLTAADTFDRTYDTTLEPDASSDQAMAAVTQAFYTTNWLHDWYYDSGFTETAGNAQLSNYGRGGEEADAMLVQIQDNADAGSANNANMSTPADGSAPRMQIYVWSGPTDSTLDVDVVGAVSFNNASFGPEAYDVTAEVATAESSGTSTACSPITNDVVGKIALVDRGSCTFVTKAYYAEAAGAVGLFLANNTSGSLSPSGSGYTATIPVVGISQSDGSAIRSALAGGTITAHLAREEFPTIDGALDNTVVSHEWGHYLHNRLGSYGNTQGSAMGEGWADFLALHMVLRDGDDPTGAYPVGAYAMAASSDDPLYYGVRRVPYSVDPALNALSFRHISDGETLPTTHPMASSSSANSEEHNAGEIWATALWEAYVALQDARDPSESFDDIRRRMSDIVVAGMALAPTDATYTEARDALLAAAYTLDPDDVTVLAEAFAARGMGSCAEAPDRDSEDLVGVVEDTSVSAVVALQAPVYADGAYSCDDDGILDGGERGTLTVRVSNDGGADLVGASLLLSADTAGVSFPDGDTWTVPDLAPFASTDVEVPVALDRSVAPQSPVVFTATVDAAGACVTSTSETRSAWVEADVSAASATSDGFDLDVGAWTIEGTDADAIWARTEEAAFAWTWLGVDVSGVTDTRLVSPALAASATDSLILAFDARWSFETSGGTYWDGGVIELRLDGGAWEDVSTYVSPGYGGAIDTTASNPLSGQSAFVATNASWPSTDAISLDFGTAFAGRSVEFAFRIGTDLAVSDYGWEIDNVALSGIDNTPFPSLIDQVDLCDPPPVADAGPDQVVAAGDWVTLDGSASADPWGDALVYAWTAPGSVSLDDPSSATPGFAAPLVTVDTVVSVQLDVTDGTSTATDTVEVTILAPPPVDTGTGDTAIVDTGDTGGAGDTGLVDTGPGDTGTVDTGTLETGTTDTDSGDTDTDSGDTDTDSGDTDTDSGDTDTDSGDTDTDSGDTDTDSGDTDTDSGDTDTDSGDTDTDVDEDGLPDPHEHGEGKGDGHDGCGCATGPGSEAAPLLVGLLALGTLGRRRARRRA